MKPVKSIDTNIMFFAFTFKYCKLYFPTFRISTAVVNMMKAHIVQCDGCHQKKKPWDSAFLFDGPSFFCSICHFYMIWTVSILWVLSFEQCHLMGIRRWVFSITKPAYTYTPPQNSIFGRSEQSQSYSLLDNPSRHSFAHRCQVKKWCGILIWRFCDGGICCFLVQLSFFFFFIVLIITWFLKKCF